MSNLNVTRDRIEAKYITTNPSILNNFLRLVNDNGFLNVYKKRSVYSLYYDDIFLSAVRDNLAGISNRKKFRLRFYSENNKLFYGWQFEKKIKTGIFGKKQIFKLPNDFDYLNCNYKIESIPNLINNQNKSYLTNLEPIIISNYIREYFEDSKGNRITIDNNLRFSKFKKFNSFVSNYGWSSSSFTIIEIKFDPNNKFVLSNLFKSMKLTQSRCSKYLLGLSIIKGFSYI